MTNNFAGARILIADDDSTIRSINYLRLTAEGYNCTVASNGNSASEKLSASKFDLALLDINMPGKSGLDVLKEIQADDSDTATVMITAIADVETAINTLKFGAYDYIVKPVDFNILMISIDRALQKRTLIQENKNYRLYLEEKVEEQSAKIKESFLNSVTCLAYALEVKDEYTSGHSQRVTEIAVAIAEELDISQENIDKLRLAGLVHDIGKIGIKESILNKPGSLTDDEYQHIKSHTGIGERILAPVVEDKEILNIVRAHHERYDGAGYPDRLEAEQIPFGARILAVADTYDAMTSNRSYRQSMSHEAACDEISHYKGKQFDPVVVDAFLKVVNKGKMPFDLLSHVPMKQFSRNDRATEAIYRST